MQNGGNLFANKLGNGLTPVEKDTNKETSFSTSQQASRNHSGVVSIQYETREGSGKIDKDFTYTQGKLVSTCGGVVGEGGGKPGGWEAPDQ